jgi:hypothetical protein
MGLFIRIAAAEPLAGPDAMKLVVFFTDGLAGTSGPALRAAGVKGKLGSLQAMPALQALQALQARDGNAMGGGWPWSAMLPILSKNIGRDTPQFSMTDSGWSSMSRSFV